MNFLTKGNAITEYSEYGTGKSGYINGAYGGDGAYLGTNNGKVKFMISGVVGEVVESEVQVVEKDNIAVVSCYIVENGRLIHKIAHDITTPGWATSLDNGLAPDYLQSGITYYGYDGHYFYTDYDTMLSDYEKDSRSNSVNPTSPYYNYFQYLPLRSKTNYAEEAISSLINGQSGVTSSSKMYDMGNAFVTQQNTYGVNALLMIGVAANESAWGTSNISQTKNNLFGLNAVDSSPGTSANTYESVEECIRQFAEYYMSRQYLSPLNWKYNGGFLGNKASGINVMYASDPYWGEKAANLIYSLEKNGGHKDYNTYTLGIKDTISTIHNSVNVRNESSTSSTILYNTGTSTDYAVIIQEQTLENGFYKIQSDGVLDSKRTTLVENEGKYLYDQMYAYISGDYVTIVSQGLKEESPHKSLDSIRIIKEPDKVIYTEGEIFDASGMKLMAVWSDGTETEVTTGIEYSLAGLLTETKQVVIYYTYDGVVREVEQDIIVNPIEEQPTTEVPEIEEKIPTVEESKTEVEVPTEEEPETEAEVPIEEEPKIEAEASNVEELEIEISENVEYIANSNEDITIESVEEKSEKIPKTEDNALLGIWGILLISSFIGLLSLIVKKRIYASEYKTD